MKTFMRAKSPMEEGYDSANEPGLARPDPGARRGPNEGPALHEIVHAEAARVIEGMQAESLNAGVEYSMDEFVRRLAAYEVLTEDLARAAALTAYWVKTTDDRLVPGIVARLANAMDRTAGQQPYLDLVRYPSLLVLYGGGLGAVIGRREEQLAGLLASPTIRERQEWQAIAVVVSGPAVIEHRIGRTLPGLERHHTPASDHLLEITGPWLQELESDQESFERWFDRWEFLDGLVAFDLSRQGRRGGWGPVGGFSWRAERGNPVDAEIGQEITSAGANWPLLRSGLFGGDAARRGEPRRLAGPHRGSPEPAVVGGSSTVLRC
jgi:hypothetical protein